MIVMLKYNVADVCCFIDGRKRHTMRPSRVPSARTFCRRVLARFVLLTSMLLGLPSPSVKI